MREREDSEFIHDIEKQLGLEQGSIPTWGYNLEKRVFAEEAPTKAQRRFASWCLRNLSFFIAGYDLARKRGEVAPLTPQHVQAFYYQERAELKERWGSAFADFTLTHVLGSAERQIAWLQELKTFEETAGYDSMLERLRPARELLIQAVTPPRGQGPNSPLP